MKIIYNGGIFYCDAQHNAQVMRHSKWKWDGDYWTTSFPEKALPLYDFCTKAAKAKIDSWKSAVLDSISDSFASSTSFNPPAPEGLTYLDYQKAGIEYCLNHSGSVLLGDPMGLGKAQPLYSKVLTPNGWRTMGSLSVGDVVCNPSGGVQWVSGVFNQGLRQSYKLHFHDGTSAESCIEHLWNVEIDGDATQTLELSEIKQALDNGSIITLPTVESPTLEIDHTLMVEPYLLGIILAGGAEVEGNSVLFRCETQSQIDCIVSSAMMIPGLTDEYRETRDGVVFTDEPICQNLIDSARQWEEVIDSDASVNNFIQFYECLKKHEKALIIQGFLDWTGTPERGYKVRIDPPSPQGMAIFKRIVMSMGGIVWQQKGQVYNSTFVAMGCADELFLSELQDDYNNLNDPSLVYFPMKQLLRIEKLGVTPMRCIRVSGPEHLYVTDDYTITHNTIQAIGYSNAVPKAERVLIICPATLKENWKKEWLKWDVHGMSVGICDSKTRTRTIKDEDGNKKIERWREDIFPDTEVVIINYEQLEKFDLRLKATSWSLVIIDEADRLGNPKTKQTKCVFGGVHKKKKDGKEIKTKFMKLKSDKTLFLTGTPIPKSPIDMWTIIQECDPDGLGRNWVSFTRRYCDAQRTGFGLDVTGASNLEELQFKMRKAFMVRRIKTEVLKDLPPKRRELVILPPDGLTKHVERELTTARKGMHEFEKMMGLAPKEDPEDIPVEDLQEFMDAFHNRFESMSHEERVKFMADTPLEIAFEEFAEARQQLSLAKIPMVQERIRRALQEEECIVVFGVHTAFMEELARGFNNYAMITGKTPVKKRQGEVDRFQNDTDCRLFFGNIRAAGVGITLTRAHLTMFGELEWNDTQVSQAEDRTWRIGQVNSCLSQHLVVAGSLDSRLVELNWEKGQIGAAALDADRLDPLKIFSQSVQF